MFLIPSPTNHHSSLFNSRNINPVPPSLTLPYPTAFSQSHLQLSANSPSNSYTNNLQRLLPSRIYKKKPHLIKKNELATLQSYDYYYQMFADKNSSGRFLDDPGWRKPSKCRGHHCCCCCCHHHHNSRQQQMMGYSSSGGGSSSSKKIRDRYDNTMVMPKMSDNLELKNKRPYISDYQVMEEQDDQELANFHQSVTNSLELFDVNNKSQ